LFLFSQKPKASKSKFAGVSYSTSSNKWLAHITIEGKAFDLGTFDSEEDAARHYDEQGEKAAGILAHKPLMVIDLKRVSAKRPSNLSTTAFC
jgi:hypothetical protein